MKKPELQDFGLTPDQYARYQRMCEELSAKPEGWLLRSLADILFLTVPVIVGAIWYLFTREIGQVIAFSLALGFAYLYLAPKFWEKVSDAVREHFKQKRYSRIAQDPIVLRARNYEYAIAAHSRAMEAAKRAAELAKRRKRLNYWRKLRGVQFEQELAAIYRRLGYEVQSTPTSGDQGIDLILKKAGMITIVQCKGQKAPAGPAVVRELYGSFVAFKDAHHAILACNGGFTQGVYQFASGKPITLVAVKELAEMGSRIQQIRPPH